MCKNVNDGDGKFREDTLAQGIVDSVREPLVVVDKNFRIVAASRSFYAKFQLTSDETSGRVFFDLSDGEWNISALRLLLERILPAREVMDDFEIEQVFPRIGRRAMLINARRVVDRGGAPPLILVAFEDVTERRATERALNALLESKELLLAEMGHRVANSLQIIASILMMKARTVKSEETREHLEDAHRRVLSIASVQLHLQASSTGEDIEVGPYLTKLTKSLTASMVGDNRRIAVEVVAGAGRTSSAEAVSLGLIVTELLINAFKHAFRKDFENARVIVGYEALGADWKLSVSDNGAGMASRQPGNAKTGLGTSLVDALAKQNEAQIEINTSANGTTVTITHATFQSRLPTVA
jgi:chemotaxis protein methyltransferase CheR